MNFAPAKIEETAAFYAKQLLANARRNEPPITADLQKIASEVSAEIIGLENKFKSEESLSRKLAEEALKSVRSFTETGYSVEKAIEKAIALQRKRNNDALRYTFVLPEEKYVFGYKLSLAKFKQKDYVIPENKIWNAWKNIGTVFDKGYRGINITIISSRKQRFELQFHTRASYELKVETHYLHRESRRTSISEERKVEIARLIIESAQQIKLPKGIRKL